MNKNKNVVRNVALTGVLIGSSTTALATGFRLPDQDAFATGRGEAFVATADNPSAIYYNPAGISQLEGQNLRGGIYGIYLDPMYTPNGSQTTYHNQDKLAAVPQLFYTINPKDSILSGGIGLYSPYGLAVRWPQKTGFRTVGEQGGLTYITLNPVLALKVSDHFSVGGGLTINYAKIDLRQGLFWPAQNNDGFKFQGTGWDVGYNLGGLWKINDQFSIGASFHSGTEIEFDGHTEDHNKVALPGIPAFRERSPASTTFPTPLNAIFGISYRPTEHWNFEFDADYTGWNTLSTVVIHQQNPSAVLPQNIPVTFNWQPSWYYEFGGTHYFDNGWHVSAGYIFNENAMPDAHYTPLVADEDRHFLSVGVGHKGKSFNFDVAYQFGFAADRKVSGSGVSPAGQTADGTYNFISHAVIGSVGLNF
jgi:long-chain fatty acid transport protein